MRSVVILAARFNEEQQRVEVAKELTLDDGTVEYNCHSFSVEALEWHAAMYDVENVDDAVDTILFEPFVQAADPKTLRQRGARAAHVQRIRDAKVALTPRNGNGAKIQDNAARKARMRAAGIPDEFVNAVDTDPREVIKAACMFDPEVLQLKRDHYIKARDKAEAEQVPVDRVARLRDKSSSKRPSGPEKKRGALPPIILGQGG